jgi:predicted acylesterase/phospholipase RssA
VSQKDKTALVLGAGGVFGAYQVGVWKALADSFKPDLVVGASVGSLNGWAIAGGCSPAELEDIWLNIHDSFRLRPRLPTRWDHGCLDLKPVEAVAEGFFSRFTPKAEYAAVVTDLKLGKARYFTAAQITPKHLLASCAVPLAFDLQRLDGRIYADGGLLAALPLATAAELGATRIVAVNVLPDPPAPLSWARSAGRTFARVPLADPEGVEIVRLEPHPPLGRFTAMLRYRRELIERWIAEGERDALRVKDSIARCFQPTGHGGDTH